MNESEGKTKSFRDYYMEMATSSFGDDLDRLRQEGSLDSRKVEMLINCLETGKDIWSDLEKTLLQFTWTRTWKVRIETDSLGSGGLYTKKGGQVEAKPSSMELSVCSIVGWFVCFFVWYHIGCHIDRPNHLKLWQQQTQAWGSGWKETLVKTWITARLAIQETN